MAEGNGQNWSADIKDLGEKIVALTVAKAVELGDYLEKVHNIKPAAGAVAIAAPTGCSTSRPTCSTPSPTASTMRNAASFLPARRCTACGSA